MATKIIGLSGFAQSGKDSIGQWLVAKRGFVRVAFADAVRDGLSALNPLVMITREESKNFDNLFGVIRLKNLVDRFGYEHAKQCQEVRELFYKKRVVSRRCCLKSPDSLTTCQRI